MTITRVHHLNCASIQGIAVLGQHLVCHVLLLETSDAGLVLVDTGLGSADYADMTTRMGFEFTRLYARPAIDPSLAAVEQIKGLGFSPKDVRHIVMTHLDLDHVGGLADFPHALVHVHEVELEAATRRSSFKAKRRYRPNLWAHGAQWRTYRESGEPWLGFEAVRGLEALGDDVLLVPLAGHTHGHVGVVVNGPDGVLLAAGDAYFDAREVKLPTRACGIGPTLFQLVVTTDFAKRRHNQDRLRALHADHPELDVFCAHNPFEYLDLVERAGQAPRGISRTRNWRPENRATGAARNFAGARKAR